MKVSAENRPPSPSRKTLGAIPPISETEITFESYRLGTNRMVKMMIRDDKMSVDNQHFTKR